ICSATHAWLIRNISYEEFDLYDDYVTDQIIALLPYIDTRIAEMVSPDEAREAIKEAREQERKDIGEQLLEMYDLTSREQRIGLLETVITKLVDGIVLKGE
ncbi:hypothetical protein LCGC14_3043550, partial [marine sediment metagenome]